MFNRIQHDLNLAHEHLPEAEFRRLFHESDEEAVESTGSNSHPGMLQQIAATFAALFSRASHTHETMQAELVEGQLPG